MLDSVTPSRLDEGSGASDTYLGIGRGVGISDAVSVSSRPTPSRFEQNVGWAPTRCRSSGYLQACRLARHHLGSSETSGVRETSCGWPTSCRSSGHYNRLVSSDTLSVRRNVRWASDKMSVCRACCLARHRPGPTKTSGVNETSGERPTRCRCIGPPKIVLSPDRL